LVLLQFVYLYFLSAKINDAPKEEAKNFFCRNFCPRECKPITLANPKMNCRERREFCDERGAIENGEFWEEEEGEEEEGRFLRNGGFLKNGGDVQNSHPFHTNNKTTSGREEEGEGGGGGGTFGGCQKQLITLILPERGHLCVLFCFAQCTCPSTHCQIADEI
jgi:hypothetical protein